MSSHDAPQTPRSGLPPVRMALRVIGRHGHRGGAHLARAVSAARAPKHLAASTRLAHPGGGADGPAPDTVAAAPRPAPAAPAPAAPAGYEAPPFAAQAAAGEAQPERPSVPGLSEWGSDFLFGDAGASTAGLVPMSEAEKLPDPPREQRLARRRARGALDVSRGARIVEGPAERAPEATTGG